MVSTEVNDGVKAQLIVPSSSHRTAGGAFDSAGIHCLNPMDPWKTNGDTNQESNESDEFPVRRKKPTEPFSTNNQHAFQNGTLENHEFPVRSFTHGSLGVHGQCIRTPYFSNQHERTCEHT